MKINPFMVRLQAATGLLNSAVDAHNVDEIARGMEDVGFWTARTVSEMISGSDEADTPAHLKLFKKGVAALFQAQAANVRARKTLRKMLTASTYTAPSAIPTAGEGAFAAKPFRQGELVGVVANKKSNSGDPLTDWTLSPLCRHLNHSPYPNLDVVPINDVEQSLVIVATAPITTDEELTVNYRNPNWPDSGILPPMEIPAEWDRNAILSKKTTDLTASATMSLGLIAGPLMLLASDRVKSPWSTVLGVGGGGISAWALFQWLKHRG